MRMREGEAALRNKLFEEASEEFRGHYYRHSTTNGEHINGHTVEFDADGNQLWGFASREHHPENNPGRVENGNGGRAYPGTEFVGVVEGIQQLSVDA